jgi:TonB family protein
MTSMVGSCLVGAALIVSVAQDKPNCPSAAHTIRNGIGKSESLVCSSPDAQYTDKAAKAKVRGAVRLAATVGEDGCAHRIRVTSSLGYGLDEAAVSAVERWRFRKPRKPVPVQIEIDFDPDTSSRQAVHGLKCGTNTAHAAR